MIAVMENKCKCGCGKEIENKKYRKKNYKGYIAGHNNKNKSNYWKIKIKVKKRTSHERANKIIKKDLCSINNNDCKGLLEIAHLDGNPFNNKKENLSCLCRSHHRILDNKKLSLNELKELKLNYYNDKNGKRRYN